MGLMGSRIGSARAGLFAVGALLLVARPASAQIPITSSGASPTNHAGKADKAAARPNGGGVEAARRRAEAGDLLEARELYRRLLSEARTESDMAESAADRAVANRDTLKAELAAVEDHFAYVSVLVQGSAGADTRVTCDGQPLPA